MSAVDRDHLKIFAGRASIDIAEAVSQHLMLPRGQGSTELFPDGELIVRVEEDVRGRSFANWSHKQLDEFFDLLCFADLCACLFLLHAFCCMLRTGYVAHPLLRTAVGVRSHGAGQRPLGSRWPIVGRR